MADSNSFRLGVLGSGKGSNFVAVAEACARGDVAAEVAIVLSDVEGVGILSQAERLGVGHRFISPGDYRTKLDEDAEREFINALREAKVDLVVLAGFMRILKGEFLRIFEGRVVNVHPSLLPSFPGLEAWKQAVDHGVKVTGATVHYVDQGVDSGPVIAQEPVPVLDDDTHESLHERIQIVEQRIYPEAIAAIASGKVALKGRRIIRDTQ
jgi:phosphoribosylglycinamide formyltransferase-1